MKMGSENNNNCHWTGGCCMFGCFASCWTIFGLIFVIVGFIIIASGAPTAFGIIWTVVSLFPLMLGCSMWYCLVKRMNEIEKVNSTSDPEVENKCQIRIQKSIASAFIGFGLLFTIVGIVIIAFDPPAYSEVDPTVKSGRSWPMILWMVISMIPIIIGCSLCYCIKKETEGGCSGHPGTTDSSSSPQVSTIKIQSAQEAHTAVTIPPSHENYQPQVHRSIFNFFESGNESPLYYTNTNIPLPHGNTLATNLRILRYISTHKSE